MVLPGVRPTHKAGRASAFGLAGRLSAAVVIIFTVVALIGPWVAPHDPQAVDLKASFWGPDAGHLLGYDAAGRDLLSRLLAGARTSFLGPLVIVGFATLLGSSIAVAAAWYGRWLDSAVVAVLDVALAFPGLLLAVLTVAIVGPGLPAATLALGVAYVPHMARLVRSAALREVGRDYVDALRVQGLPAVRIAVRHVLPNIWPIVIGQAALTLAWATVDLAALSYLGLGVQPPQPDWGVMVAAGQSGVLQGYPAESVVAGVCLVVAAGAFNLLGQRLLRRCEGARAR
ncbi:ABC transporter permease [Kribbella turkmenica]|uniref:ABC transporter permease n=2 Tax=Kribbella turkmenica TaxID=2530375 RepID=A0A4R4XI08_9ACTN|nr:ABC transporter permease [Kribbella turkmenica]